MTEPRQGTAFTWRLMVDMRPGLLPPDHLELRCGLKVWWRRYETREAALEAVRELRDLGWHGRAINIEAKLKAIPPPALPAEKPPSPAEQKRTDELTRQDTRRIAGESRLRAERAVRRAAGRA